MQRAVAGRAAACRAARAAVIERALILACWAPIACIHTSPHIQGPVCRARRSGESPLKKTCKRRRLGLAGGAQRPER